MRNRILNLLLLLVTLIVCLGLGEIAYRAILFGDNKKFESLRKPDLYADYFSDDDYWKLYHTFGGEFGPPDTPHALLGWVGRLFDRQSLSHSEGKNVGKKRPVLLYGDSFAECVNGADCFQNILNNDSAFGQENYLLNYGVGGYAVDQITLLCKQTYKRFDKPIVVLSVMTSDLDRTVLTNRIGQKPYYEIRNDSLQLRGVPIESDPEKFFEEHPPRIKSYLWRRLLYTPRNPLPDYIKAKLKHEDAKNNYKAVLNERVLQDIVDELRGNNIDFVFLVFHYVQKGNSQFSVEQEDNWRDKLLRDFIAKNKLPYIWSKDLIKKDSAYNGSNLEKYMMEDNGHPTTYFNTLIANEIKNYVLSVEQPTPTP